MRSWMCIMLLLVILLALPQIIYAGPLTYNGMVEGTETSSAETTDTLSKALGTLAVYAAIIGALAVGTEVITDLIRPFLGLKRQPQALETFEQMKEWLPSTLKEMDASPQAQAQLQGYLSQLDATVKQFEQATDPDRIAEVVQRWALDAIRNAEALLGAHLQHKLEELEAFLRTSDLALVAEQALGEAERILVANLSLDEAAAKKLAKTVRNSAQALEGYLEHWAVAGGRIDQALAAALQADNKTLDDLVRDLVPPGASLSPTILQEVTAALTNQLGLRQEDVDDALKSATEILSALHGGQQFSRMLQDFRAYLRKLLGTKSKTDTAIAKAFELMNTLADDVQIEKELKGLLVKQGLSSANADKAITQARGLLKALRGAEGGQDVIKLAASLDSFSNLLDEVEIQRLQEIGLLRRLWRAVRDWKGARILGRLPDRDPWKEVRKRWVLGALLYSLEQGWNKLRDELFSSAEGKQSLSTLLTPENAAKAIQNLDRQHYLTEARRQRLLRFTTVVIGIALAFVVRIDSLDLLEPLFTEPPQALYVNGQPKSLELIMEELLRVDWDVESWTGLRQWLFAWIAVATPGMILSGLAASAGSSFWHDQLDRLRATKLATEQVTAVVTQLRSPQSQAE
jgi:hypothetical protein